MLLSPAVKSIVFDRNAYVPIIIPFKIFSREYLAFILRPIVWGRNDRLLSCGGQLWVQIFKSPLGQESQFIFQHELNLLSRSVQPTSHFHFHYDADFNWFASSHSAIFRLSLHIIFQLFSWRSVTCDGTWNNKKIYSVSSTGEGSQYSHFPCTFAEPNSKQLHTHYHIWVPWLVNIFVSERGGRQKCVW